MFYDKTDRNSIYQYAKKLEGKTFNDICNEDMFFLKENVDNNEYKADFRNSRRKGGLGELVEERHFHYKADNEARADFPEAELELKVTPYKINKNKTLSAKERLSISMINFMEIVKTEFYDSNVWEKIKNILLIFYEWNPELEDRLDYIIRFIYLYSPSSEDLAIIMNDYEKIKQKVRDGLAHELSEGDTMYLGAATKSSSSKNLTSQPYSDIQAKPRAFSFKNSYLTYLLRNEVVPAHEQEKKQDKIIKDDQVYDLEAYILEKINKYKGRATKELYNEFVTEGAYGKTKNAYSQIAYALLGVRTEKAVEFEKANIEVKTIRFSLKKSGGYTMKESISFPTFKIKELVKEEWETSSIRQQFEETKYLFVIYKEVEPGAYVLDGARFWNMPMSDIEGKLRSEWIRARDTFRDGVHFWFEEQKKATIVKNNLPALSDTEILHVRPHASRSAYRINSLAYTKGNLKRDADELLNGDLMTKQCFWINNKYLRRVLES